MAIRERYIKSIYIGEGAFSKVYRAWDTQARCFVACKEIANIQLARREARLLSKAQHPLFAGYIDYWEESGKGILVMEYVSGECLDKLLARRKALSERVCIEIALELASGLLYLHERDETIIFRDLKPANIMIRQDGRVKLLDMGCACYVTEGERNIAGTPEYGAWEQFRAGEEIGAFTDVYALGRVLKALVGECRDGSSSRITGIIELCTRENSMERLPNMRSLIKVLAEYHNRINQPCGKHRHEKCKFLPAMFSRKLSFDTIIYQKSVWKKAQSS